MKRASLLFLAAALTAVAAPSALAATPAGCFRMSQMRNHTVGDARTLYVAVRGKEVYRFTMVGGCLAAKSSSDPIITQTASGTDQICRPIDLNLKVGGAGGVSHCIIDRIERLTPDEVAALPRKVRP